MLLEVRTVNVGFPYPKTQNLKCWSHIFLKYFPDIFIYIFCSVSFLKNCELSQKVEISKNDKLMAGNFGKQKQ